MTISMNSLKFSACFKAINILSICAFLFPLTATSAEKEDSLQKEKFSYMPQINGTVRAKYEWQPQDKKGRFQVRNARVAISGKIMPIIGYKAEIDLCDEGKIKMLDAYGRFFAPWFNGNLTLGQMRVPFSIDAHRSPHTQYFANRSFIAKQAGNVRDVGLAAAYTTPGNSPITLEAGIFNGSGLTNQKDFWTSRFNFSFKAQAKFFNCLTVSASAQRSRPEDVGIMMWDAGAFFDNGLWHFEAEYLRKNYDNGAHPGVNAVDAFAFRRFKINRALSSILALLRYDFMSDHSTGIYNDHGVLVADDPQRHRITAGATLRFEKFSRYAEVRVNYEKYFYQKGVTPPVSGRDKMVVELMVRF